jgi:hypothetical protein
LKNKKNALTDYGTMPLLNNRERARAMVKTGSIFSQLLRFISQEEFSKIAAKHKSEKASKGFSSWTQLVSMLFCHLAGAESLREICTGLECCLGKLKHLGLSSGVWNAL